MRNIICKYYKYMLIFVFFLFFNLILPLGNIDEIWTYGFTYNMFKKLIPYIDFNMIIPPFYPFIMSLPMHLFGESILVYHIETAIYLTISFYLLENMLGEKKWLALLFLVNAFNISFPSYNLFLVFLFILLIYFERKNKDSDLLIGILLGLAILTKHSVGIVLLLPSICYIKKKKKAKLRVVGILIPIVLCFIYLLLSKSLMNFIDLCILGLFDFTTNTPSFNGIYILSIIYLIICFILIKRDPKNIINYYALTIFSIAIPLFDFYHFFLSFFCLVVVLLSNYDIKIKLNFKLFFFGVTILTTLLSFYTFYDGKIVYPNHIHNFEYRLLSYERIEYTEEINRYIKKNKNRKIIFLTNDAYYFRIINGQRISYYDLINYGNHGYNGSKKLLKLIKRNKDALFIVDKEQLDISLQTDKNVIKYIMENGKKIDKVYKYDVYRIER